MKELKIAVLLRRLLAKPSSVHPNQVLGQCGTAALNAALYLAANKKATVTAISLGRSRREDKVLRAALEAGCHRAIRVYDQSLDKLDVAGKAKVLAGACRKHGADIVLCGDRSQDTSHGAVGPAVAEALSIPHLSHVVGLKFSDGSLHVSVRQFGKRLVLAARPPIALCVRQFPEQPQVSASSAGTPTELSLKDLGLKSRDLNDLRLTGDSEELRQGNNATMLQSASELVSRLRQDRLL